MFGKNRKKGTTKNTFGDKGYTMKERYNADELIVANFQRISSEGTDFGPKIETTNQKYIFEKIVSENSIKYREIFTGFITECVDDTSKDGFDFQYFDLPYVFEPKKFTDYFPETKGIEIPKLSLIWAQNDINYTKAKDNAIHVKEKKKRK